MEMAKSLREIASDLVSQVANFGFLAEVPTKWGEPHKGKFLCPGNVHFPSSNPEDADTPICRQNRHQHTASCTARVPPRRGAGLGAPAVAGAGSPGEPPGGFRIQLRHTSALLYRPPSPAGSILQGHFEKRDQMIRNYWAKNINQNSWIGKMSTNLHLAGTKYVCSEGWEAPELRRRNFIFRGSFAPLTKIIGSQWEFFGAFMAIQTRNT